MLGGAGLIRGQGRGGLVGGVDGRGVYYIKLDVVVVAKGVLVVVLFILFVQGGRGRRQGAQERVPSPVGADGGCSR